MKLKEIIDYTEKQDITRLILEALPEWFGISEARENYNKVKSANSKQPECPEEKVKAIEDALRHFQMI